MEIFEFYTKQSQVLGKAPTFDKIQNVKNFITINNFAILCRDFKIYDKIRKVDFKIVAEGFKKYVIESKRNYLTFEEFINLMEDIA